MGGLGREVTPWGCRESRTFTPFQLFRTGDAWFTRGEFGTGFIPVLTPIQQGEGRQACSSPKGIKSNVLSELFNLDRGLRTDRGVVRGKCTGQN